MFDGLQEVMEVAERIGETLSNNKKLSVEDIREYVDKRMNELWEIIPDYETVINEKHSKMDCRNLGIYMGLEEVGDFIEKGCGEMTLEQKSKRLLELLDNFSKELSETPYNNTPITDAQTAIKSLTTFLRDPKQYDPNDMGGVPKERIIAAAYKVKPEYVCNRGGVYKVGTKERDDIYQCRIGRHHSEIIHIFGDEINLSTDGFYTSFGRWVDRKEAAKIALECGQTKGLELHYWSDKLDSHDLI